MFGVDPRILRKNTTGLPGFVRDARRYAHLTRRDDAFPVRLTSLRPILDERHAQAGGASGHWFHQDLRAAQKIYGAQPAEHLDIGSRIDGFVAHVLAFMPVTVLDIRPLTREAQALASSETTRGP
jgi:hypothetical protein